MDLLRRAARSLFGGRSGPLLIALGACLLLLAATRPNYFTVDNVRVIGLNVTSVAIASMGTTFLIISGRIDLSIGAIFATTAYVGAVLSLSLPPPLAWAGALAAGAAIGYLNGLLTWRIRVSPIIVTLAMLALIRGVLLVVSNGRGVAEVPPDFTVLGRSLPLGVPLQLWILIGIVIVAEIVLSRTVLGRHVYAVGGSAEAAEISGVAVRRIALGAFAVNGLLVGLSGVIAASRFGTATSQFGIGFELDVITAVILGGVAFTGGEGTIRGVLLAVVFLGVVNSGMISLGIPAFWVDVVKGGALLASVAIEQLTQERRERDRKRVAMAEFAQQMAEQRSAAGG